MHPRPRPRPRPRPPHTSRTPHAYHVCSYHTHHAHTTYTTCNTYHTHHTHHMRAHMQTCTRSYVCVLHTCSSPPCPIVSAAPSSEWAPSPPSACASHATPRHLHLYLHQICITCNGYDSGHLAAGNVCSHVRSHACSCPRCLLPWCCCRYGPVLTGPTVLSIELAERLTSLRPAATWAILGKNGSDVTTAAARAARAGTGRQTILRAVDGGAHMAYVTAETCGRGVSCVS